MDIEILKKNHEPLMHRTHFEAKVVFEGKTPSRRDMMKDLCQKLSSKEGLTVVRKISTDYGSERALLNGYVYDDEKTMNILESQFVKLRHLTKEQQKAEKEKAKAAKQAVVPVVEKKKK
jgi:small subunit ribosomal protein S24e